MENQHRKITGYRDLSQNEINLMNKIKALGPMIEEVQKEIEDHVAKQRIDCYNQIDNNQQDKDETANGKEELQRLEDATPERFIALAKTDFQTALMYLTRAVAQPTFF